MAAAKVVHQGILGVCKKGGRVEQRYFALQRDRLEYFGSKEDFQAGADPRGRIALSDILQCEETENGFSLRLGGDRGLEVKSDDEAELLAWLDALEPLLDADDEPAGSAKPPPAPAAGGKQEGSDQRPKTSGMSQQTLSTIKQKLKAAAHHEGNVDWAKLIRKNDGDKFVEIDFSEFRSLIRKDATISEHAFPDDSIKDIFLSIDTTNSGKIVFDQFLRFMDVDPSKANEAAPKSPRDQIKQGPTKLFEHMDVNNDGTIDIHEMRAAHKAGVVQANESLLKSPREGVPNAQMKQEQQKKQRQQALHTIKNKLKAAGYDHDRVNWKKLFRHYDRDNSGEINFSEFRSLIRKDAEITQVVLSDDDLKSLFSSTGGDHSGNMDIAEFIQWMDPEGTTTAGAKEAQHNPEGVAEPQSSEPQGVARLPRGSWDNPGIEEEALQEIKSKLNAAAHEHGGQNWTKFFSQYDKLQSGEIDYEAFVRMIRNEAKVPERKVSDQTVKRFFDSVRKEHSGKIAIDELREWLSTGKDLNALVPNNYAKLEAQAHAQVKNSVDEATLKLIKQKLKAASLHDGKADWSKLFKSYDRHNSGDIDFDEFRRLIRKDAGVLQDTLSDEALQALANTVDTQQSGKIRYESFLQWVAEEGAAEKKSQEQAETDRAAEEKLMKVVIKRLQSAAYDADGVNTSRKLFGRYDRDHSGDIDYDEFKQLVRKDAKLAEKDASEELLRKIFKHLDKGNTGRVQFQGFLEYLDPDRKFREQDNSKSELQIRKSQASARDPQEPVVAITANEVALSPISAKSSSMTITDASTFQNGASESTEKRCEGSLVLLRKGKADRRHFVLFEDRIEYFMDAGGVEKGERRGMVMLAGIARIEEKETGFVIHISDAARSLELGTDTDAETSKWLGALAQRFKSLGLDVLVPTQQICETLSFRFELLDFKTVDRSKLRTELLGQIRDVGMAEPVVSRMHVALREGSVIADVTTMVAAAQELRRKVSNKPLVVMSCSSVLLNSELDAAAKHDRSSQRLHPPTKSAAGDQSETAAKHDRNSTRSQASPISIVGATLDAESKTDRSSTRSPTSTKSVAHTQDTSSADAETVQHAPDAQRAFDFPGSEAATNAEVVIGADAVQLAPDVGVLRPERGSSVAKPDGSKQEAEVPGGVESPKPRFVGLKKDRKGGSRLVCQGAVDVVKKGVLEPRHFVLLSDRFECYNTSTDYGNGLKPRSRVLLADIRDFEFDVDGFTVHLADRVYQVRPTTEPATFQKWFAGWNEVFDFSPVVKETAIPSLSPLHQQPSLDEVTKKKRKERKDGGGSTDASTASASSPLLTTSSPPPPASASASPSPIVSARPPEGEMSSAAKHTAILHQGLLSLQRKGQSELRYFALYFDRVDYFTNEKDFVAFAEAGGKPRGRILIGDIKEVDVLETGFAIKLADRSLVLNTADKSDFEKWQAAWTKALEQRTQEETKNASNKNVPEKQQYGENGSSNEQGQEKQKPDVGIVSDEQTKHPSITSAGTAPTSPVQANAARPIELKEETKVETTFPQKEKSEPTFVPNQGESKLQQKRGTMPEMASLQKAEEPTIPRRNETKLELISPLQKDEQRGTEPEPKSPQKKDEPISFHKQESKQELTPVQRQEAKKQVATVYEGSMTIEQNGAAGSAYVVLLPDGIYVYADPVARQNDDPPQVTITKTSVMDLEVLDTGFAIKASGHSCILRPPTAELEAWLSSLSNVFADDDAQGQKEAPLPNASQLQQSPQSPCGGLRGGPFPKLVWQSMLEVQEGGRGVWKYFALYEDSLVSYDSANEMAQGSTPEGRIPLDQVQDVKVGSMGFVLQFSSFNLAFRVSNEPRALDAWVTALHQVLVFNSPQQNQTTYAQQLMHQGALEQVEDGQSKLLHFCLYHERLEAYGNTADALSGRPCQSQVQMKDVLGFKVLDHGFIIRLPEKELELRVVGREDLELWLAAFRGVLTDTSRRQDRPLSPLGSLGTPGFGSAGTPGFGSVPDSIRSPKDKSPRQPLKLVKVLKLRFPSVPWPPPDKFEVEIRRQLQCVGAPRIIHHTFAGLNNKDGCTTAEVTGQDASLEELRRQIKQNFSVLGYKVAEVLLGTTKVQVDPRSASQQQKEGLVYQGFLGIQHGGCLSQKYFMLFQDRLDYYDSKDDALAGLRPRGRIALSEVASYEAYGNGFILKLLGRSLGLHVGTDATAQQWTTFLNQAFKQANVAEQGKQNRRAVPQQGAWGVGRLAGPAGPKAKAKSRSTTPSRVFSTSNGSPNATDTSPGPASRGVLRGVGLSSSSGAIKSAASPAWSSSSPKGSGADPAGGWVSTRRIELGVRDYDGCHWQSRDVAAKVIERDEKCATTRGLAEMPLADKVTGDRENGALSGRLAARLTEAAHKVNHTVTPRPLRNELGTSRSSPEITAKVNEGVHKMKELESSVRHRFAAKVTDSGREASGWLSRGRHELPEKVQLVRPETSPSAPTVTAKEAAGLKGVERRPIH